jgi:GT2 family glycosyltransferase/Flp pilus assembly protein TadD
VLHSRPSTHSIFNRIENVSQCLVVPARPLAFAAITFFLKAILFLECPLGPGWLVLHLFGPVSAAFASEYLAPLRKAGCFTFGYEDGVDVRITPDTAWQDVLARLPIDSPPQFVALWLAEQPIPHFCWETPVPVICIVADWRRHWHGSRFLAIRDYPLITDEAGTAAWQLAGLSPFCSANVVGLGQSAFSQVQPPPDSQREIDILCWLEPSSIKGGDDLSWLTTLANFRQHHRVVIRQGGSDKEFLSLLSQSKIVLAANDDPATQRRGLEAALAGCLLFLKEGLSISFESGKEYIPWNPESLESLLHQYLNDPKARHVVAASGQQRAHGNSFWWHWSNTLQKIASHWDAHVQQCSRRKILTLNEQLQVQILFGSALANRSRQLTLSEPPQLIEIVAQATADRSLSPSLLIDWLTPTLETESSQIVVLLNLLSLWNALGNKQQVNMVARRVLDVLRNEPRDLGDPLFLPVGFRTLKQDWEKAGWSHPGQPRLEDQAKRELAAWIAQTLLALSSEEHELIHYFEAASLRPDSSLSHASLGCALARKGHFNEAIHHLRQALVRDPFDRLAGRALFEAFGEVRDLTNQRKMAQQQRFLAECQSLPLDDWLAYVPPSGDELASLIILCCNEVEVTRLCLDSVFRHTRQPYEIILIDNASTDGTAEYLRLIQKHPCPQRIEIIHNSENRGYPAGVNQGLAVAQGDYLVLLNNDVVVTPHWLDRLVASVLHDWPAIGLAGAVTNYAPPPQQVKAGYAALTDLDSFANSWAKAHSGQACEVARLTGFCLLLRRDVFEKIGSLDEQFGLGFFDDDDLCLRARQAGFRLALTQDCYVHHFGSQTFRSLGVDTEALLDANLAIYRDKWGDTEASKYRPVNLNAAANTSVKPKVSLTMIVKNEEHHLSACLESVKHLVDEMIVVDTGSTDRTREIVEVFGAKLYEFPWINHFAAARNEALRYATGDWVLWMDADDRIDPENQGKLKKLIDSLTDENAAFVMKCYCLGDGPGGATTVDHVRLFRNLPAHRWKYRVHEQILPSIRASRGDVRWSDVTITHVGYADPAARGRKLQRDLRLLNQEREEQPDDPFTLFNLGSIYHELQQPTEAIPVLTRSLERSHPQDSIVRKLYALIAQCQRQLNQSRESLATLSEGRGHYPDDPELLFIEAQSRRDIRDFAGAEKALQQLIQGQEQGNHFGSIAEGLRGHKARHNLAVLYFDTDRLSEAEQQWRLCLDEQPNFLPSFSGIGEIYLRQNRWEELESLVLRMESLNPEGEIAAASLRARGKMERGEVANARWALDQAIGKYPDSLSLRVLLSHAALRAGLDREAEEALQDVLALAPHHAECRFNLAILRAKRHLSPGEEISIPALYRIALKQSPSVQAKLTALYELARQNASITLLGEEDPNIVTTLLAAQPQVLRIHLNQQPVELDLLIRLAQKTQIQTLPLEQIPSDPVALLVVGSTAPCEEMVRMLGESVLLLEANDTWKRFLISAAFRQMPFTKGRLYRRI